MNEHRERSGRFAREPVDPRTEAEIARDLLSMKETTAGGLPSLASAARNARRRNMPATPVTWRELIVFTIHRTFLRRPWLLIGAVAAVLFALVVPISIERTTGSDVTLTLGNTELGADRVTSVAKQMKAVLGADRVTVQDGAEAGAGLTLRAFVPGRTGSRASALAQALAGGLKAQGYAASVMTTPRRERISSPLLAFAVQQVIEIRTDGKSAAELEAEIRQRFAEAGISDASVSVTDEGGNQKIAIKIEHKQIGEPSSGQEPSEPPQLVLTKDGVPLDAKGFTVKVNKVKNESGTTLRVEVRDADRSASAEVTGADTKSDAEIAAAIDAQLRQAGIDARVTVTGGQVSIEER